MQKTDAPLSARNVRPTDTPTDISMPFRIPAPECSLIARSNMTALSVGDALALSKSRRQESPSQPLRALPH